jgi:hypothetical protein
MEKVLAGECRLLSLIARLHYPRESLNVANYMDYTNTLTEASGRAGLPDQTIRSMPLRSLVMLLQVKCREPLAHLLPDASPAAIHLLDGLLQFDPAKCFTAEEALTHPFVAGYGNADGEPSCHKIDIYSG